MAAMVLLDFGGTLDADGLPWVAQFFAAYRDEGGQVAEPAFTSAFSQSDEALAGAPGIRELGFRATLLKQAELLSERLPRNPPQFERVAEQVHRNALATVERNRRVLEALRVDGHRLGVVSNFTGNLDCCLDELGLTEYFDVTVDSALVGHAKPDERIFRAAEEALDISPSEEGRWMVGDNPEADIRAAVGFCTVWLAPAWRRVPADLKPTARISALTDLPGIIRRHERAHSRRG